MRMEECGSCLMMMLMFVMMMKWGKMMMWRKMVKVDE